MPARVRSGPAGDPTALNRSRDGHTWTRLPATGLPAELIPRWPDRVECEPEDLQMWQEYWSQRPQAWLWKTYDQGDLFAVYCRAYAICAAEPSPPRTTALRQLADTLMLSIPALRSAKIVVDETLDAPAIGLDVDAAVRHTAQATVTAIKTPSARERLARS